ncbi:MAG TPA: CDP-glycerol glycerophosphotransferase family protein [Candidatus Limnocylindria bacterium]|nr:CDP-glycerol glycerophosphotransferase family protein [Candidatus Limnocylindria bacterium]
MSALIVAVRTWLVRIGFLLGSLGPPRRHVLLATGHADRLGGNLEVIRDELAGRRLPHRVLAHRTAGGWRGRLAGALAAVRGGYALARARIVVVDDYFFPIYVIRPRPGTTIVQTWHASGAFKRFGHSVRDASFGADAALTARVRIHANYDVCLVGSAEAAAHYADAFGLPLDRFRWDLGIPRTDAFFANERPAAEQRVRERYGIPAGRRVVLWAPTFRGDRVTDARDADALDLGTLATALSDDHVLLLRLHPFVRDRLAIPAGASAFVRDVSAHPDISELMFVSDALVTDYSSAIFEFSLLERPMAFFAPDLDAYERERGFYADYRSWVPGPVFERTEDLATWLRSGEPDLDRVRRFRDASFAVADGRATARLVDEVLLPALG